MRKEIVVSVLLALVLVITWVVGAFTSVLGQNTKASDTSQKADPGYQTQTDLNSCCAGGVCIEP